MARCSMPATESFFLATCQRITEYYIESRYPVGVTTPLEHSALESDLAATRSLVELIQQKMTGADSNK